MDAVKSGRLISQARRENGLTQQQLADLLSITGAAVSKWERGRSFPDVSILEPLAEILGLSVIDILRGERGDGGHISAEEAENSIKSAIRLMAADLEISRIPKQVRSFFAPKYYQKALAIVLSIVGLCLTAAGAVLSLAAKPYKCYTVVAL